MSIWSSWCSEMPLAGGRYVAMSFWQSQISFFIFPLSAMIASSAGEHVTGHEVPDLAGM
ncbi:hypothetical protein GOL81_15680 [Sinorhizobium medicae]|nr:hypothetical protein [Sinorhizobium medicae]MDX0733395.1 hypothetical protein [Sinorhizobium medicae]MDX1100838.1 hypothetical protein [Sinorhizobium medicae]